MKPTVKKQYLAGVCLVTALFLVLAGCGVPAPGSTVTPAPTALSSPPASPAGVQPATPPAVATSTQSPSTVASPMAPLPTGSITPASVALRFDENRAMQDVRTLAQPQFMGRHAGTPGEVMGADYLVSQFQAAGLKPAGSNGTFIQEFPMTVTEFTAVPELTLIDQSGGEHSLHLRDDFRPLIGGAAGPGAAEGPGIFAGTGDFTNVDVKGKIAMVVPRVRLSTLISNAQSAGALALVLTTGEQPILKAENEQPNADNTMPVFLVSTQGAEALLAGSGHTRDELNSQLSAGQPVPSFPLTFTVRLNSQVETHPIVARNVIGLLPATTPTDNTCIVGGHYEEIGPDPDGVVYPAANDNASGTSVVLEMARTVAPVLTAPKVNVLFIGWSGHEEGLLGSEYYVNNPMFPLSNTQCYINLDTVGQGSGQDLVMGTPDSRIRGAIDDSLTQIEAASGVRMPVQTSQQGSGASDYLNFEQKGVAYVDINWSGILEGGNIHVPGDTASNVDPQKLKVTGQVTTAVLMNLIGGAG